ncbi:peptidoglycan D,D-transpeptidase FtsI family protein [Thermovibrio sp.]
MRLLIFLKELLLKLYGFFKPFKEDRLNYFIFISFVMVVIFIWRVFDLSYFSREKWLKLASSQFTGVLKLSSERGELLDRNGSLLAASLKVVSFYVRPTEIGDWELFKKVVKGEPEVINRYAKERGVKPERVSELLKPLSVITEAELQKAYEKKYTVVKTKSGKEIKVPFVWLKKEVAENPKEVRRAVRLALRIYYTLSGENRFKKEHPDLIGFLTEYTRVYPYKVGSTVIGITNKFGEGLYNLEYLLEKKNMITGKTLELSGEKDARGRVYLGKEVAVFLRKEKGNNVQLTIDGNLQYIFEKIVEKYGQKWHPDFINAILMDPNTGEVLAAVSWPYFKYGEKRTKKNLRHLTPRYITTPYEPGSVMKPLVLAAALNEGLITKDTVFHCPPTMKVGDKTFKNEFHGKDVHLRAWEIIQYSDNVGIIQVAQKLGKKKLYEYYRAFGFGSRTGIELPGESPGILRNWKKWRDVDFATLAFGHNISATTLQLAAAYSTLVNGGIYYRPRILKAVIDEKGRVVKEFPTVKERRVISEKVSQVMRRILTMVVEGGTGVGTKFVNFYVGGKTGTAVKYDPKLGTYNRSKITATFAGAFPITDPRYVLVVTVDEPKVPKNMLWASKIAVPLFRELSERVLLYERTAPDKREYRVEPGGEITYTEINKDFVLTNGLQQKKK